MLPLTEAEESDEDKQQLPVDLQNAYLPTQPDLEVRQQPKFSNPKLRKKQEEEKLAQAASLGQQRANVQQYGGDRKY